MIKKCAWCDNPIHEDSPIVTVTLHRIENGLKSVKELAHYHVNCSSWAIQNPPENEDNDAVRVGENATGITEEMVRK